MGLGIVVGGGPDGLYSVDIKYNRDTFNKEVARLTTLILQLSMQITSKEIAL